ncbi:hypothetical protein IKN40_05895 [bacterium]|nr:hypothetical protein [bacterium]
MELIDKILIKNKERASELIKEWDNARFNHSLSVDDFEQFPAILIYYVDEHDYSVSYSARIYYGIIYLDDFEESLLKYIDNFIKKFNNHPSENDEDDKFIGCHVFAGGELNGIAGIIVGTEIDEYGEKWYKIEDEDSGYIERYIFDELKFPKIKIVYE